MGVAAGRGGKGDGGGEGRALLLMHASASARPLTHPLERSMSRRAPFNVYGCTPILSEHRNFGREKMLDDFLLFAVKIRSAACTLT